MNKDVPIHFYQRVKTAEKEGNAPALDELHSSSPTENTGASMPSSETVKMEIKEIDTKRLEKFFTDIDDDAFIKAQKISALELTHAIGLAYKEKDLETALAQTSRRVSKA